MTSLAFEWCGSDKLQSHHVHLAWVIPPFFLNVISCSIISYRISLSSCIYNFIIVHWIPLIHQIAVCCADFLIFAEYLILRLLLGLSQYSGYTTCYPLVSAPKEGDSSSHWCGVRENHCLFLFFGVYFTRDILWHWFCLRSQFRLWKNLLMKRWVWIGCCVNCRY